MSDQDSSGLFLFLIFLPVFMALGHDVFLFFTANNDIALDVQAISRLYHEDRPGRGFSFASLGYIWTTYSPETFRMATDSFTPEEWAGIRKFLSFKAVIVAAAFSFLIYIFVLIGRLFGSIGKRRRNSKL